MTNAAETRPGDRAQIDRLRRYASLLDDVVRVPGTRFRFGLDALLGLVPGVGDVAGALFALAIVFEGMRQRLPRRVLLRMVLNVAVDTGMGTVPLIGDLFDAIWKSNRRNLELLERHVTGQSSQPRASRIPGLLALVVLLLFCVLLAVGSVWVLSRLEFSR